MSKKRMITRLLSVATAVTVGLSFCACGATPEEPKENRREEAEQKDTEKERKDAEKASISLEGEYKPASFEQRDINSDTIRWMCSAYAIYSAYNDKSLEVVGGLAGDDREWYREEVKEALAGGWGIYDRKDVEDTLEDLLEEGHRKQYKEAVSELKKAEILELSSGEAMVEIAGYDSLSEEEVCKYQTAYEAYQKYGENGIDGWDYCRALQILGDCYQAEYINLEECLDLSLPIAQELQKTYENWDGVAESYLYGYSFWKGERTDDYDSQKRWEVYEELKNMESGPYTVPYDTKLENTWKDGAKAKEKEDKDDAKAGYVSVKAGELGEVKVRLPEDYVWQEDFDSSTGMVLFEKENPEGGVDLSVSYKLRSKEEFPDMVEMEEESALSKEKTRRESAEGKGVFESSGIQTKKVGDLDVSYIMFYDNLDDTSIHEIDYYAWAPIGDSYLLLAEVSHADNKAKELMIDKEGLILDTVFVDIKY
ncbi:hypothetical protein F230042K4_11680 [Mediterraneibacter glycyrrhizinilyticus]|uniref:DUF1266 domain-containing protein n=1 Tax=Mediterraneibacter glycyrrhizinilyticus TaxID=342942 RepID=UPI0036F23AA7